MASSAARSPDSAAPSIPELARAVCRLLDDTENHRSHFIFGTGDFVTALIDGGYELGPKQDVAAVPEPTSALLFVIGLVGFATFRCRPQK